MRSSLITKHDIVIISTVHKVEITQIFTKRSVEKKITDEIADNAKLSHAQRFLTDKPDPHDEKIT